MNSSQIEYVYHLFPNPSTVELKFKKSGDHLSLIIHQNIGVVLLHYKGKSVNILDEYVLTEMDQMIGEIEKLILDGVLHGIMFYSLKKDSFIVGADVNMIYTITDSRKAKELSKHGQSLTRRIELLPVVVLAAIHGSCLGGGFEICLAASHRVCSSSNKTVVGLPETKLGLAPGCGGCVRLPRLIGLENALQIILQGTHVETKKALNIGMIDQIFPYSAEAKMQSQSSQEKSERPPQEDIDFFQRCFDYTRQLALENTQEREKIVSETVNNILELATKGKAVFNQEPSFQLEKYKRRTITLSEYLKDNPIGRLLIGFFTNTSIQKQTKGHPYKSPFLILDTIMNGYTKTIDEALELEATSFSELVIDPVSKNLISLFNTVESAKKAENFCDPKYCSVKCKDVIKKIGVIGSGTMGAGIAQLCLLKGYNVYLKEVEFHYLERGLKRIRNELFGKLVEIGKMTEHERDEMMQKQLESGLEYEPLENCQMVIEAALERVDIKKEVLEKAQSLNKNIIFATNTSSIPLTSIAEESDFKQNVIGLHFFNPVHKMPLVEIICTPYTSQEVLARCYQLALDLGKLPIVVNDSPGFLTTRLFAVYCLEATSIVLDGVPFEEIDKRLQQFGFAAGPLSTLDHSGLDIAVHVMPIIAGKLNLKFDHYEALSELVKGGNVGVKNHKGFFLYDENGRQLRSNPEALRIIGKHQSKRERRVNIATIIDDLIDRCILTLINEASKCIEENIVSLPEAIDLSLILGFGFPPFLGGLLNFADRLGIANIVKRLDELAERYETVKAPCRLLRDMANSNHHFFPERMVIHNILDSQRKQNLSKL
ncbi:hypothetical protein C9374_000889 [Naegleria lovaniensis]|uniref:Enoyl-CoA hydratase n=1 Tax=Naegleria lovaniensis TaxID=51637 RepID=A0AA88GYJ3_NAELO|nr:uncharacterized protein C9374_000889 [Naegleria lovaniensis]KAG2388039.1 hypothetical protein C9374_000889 [Naegleria lovaniensis]